MLHSLTNLPYSRRGIIKHQNQAALTSEAQARSPSLWIFAVPRSSGVPAHSDQNMPQSAGAKKTVSALSHLEKPKLVAKSTISQDRTGQRQNLLVAISHRPREVVLKGGRFEAGVGKKDRASVTKSSLQSSSSPSNAGGVGGNVSATHIGSLSCLSTDRVLRRTTS